MYSTLNHYLLLAMVPLVVAMAFRAPFRWFLYLDLLLVALPGQWVILGLMIGPTDVVIAGVALALVLRGRGSDGLSWRRIPYFRIWLLLGFALSASYLAAPMNQEYFTNPFRIVYQLYRYCWRGLLYYPMVILFLRDARATRTTLLVMVIAADIFSLMALPQGYGGVRAWGPFEAANGLGAALVGPILAGIGLLVYPGSGARFWFSVISLGLTARALLFSASRGAFVGIAVAAVILLFWLRRIRALVPRVRRLAAIAAVGVFALILLVPNIADRPNLSRMLSATEGTSADNFRWRIQTRWPHFWSIAVEHPWLGIGTEVDQSLGRAANTPHNGYLAIAVKHGFPALVLLLSMVAMALRDGMRGISRGGDPWWRMLAAVSCAGIIGMLVHNIVDSVFLIPFTRDLLWLFVGLCVLAARPPEPG